MWNDRGYSFLDFGGTYQDILDTIFDACRRFGAEKAMSVIATAIDPCPAVPLTIEALREEILHETGITTTDDDLLFLGKIAEANIMIREASKLLRDACHGRK